MADSRAKPEPVNPLGIARIAITPGEPAGIGPDIIVQLAQKQQRAQLVVFGDPALLEDRAKRLGLSLSLTPFKIEQAAQVSPPGELSIYPIRLATHPEPGQPDPVNANNVLEALQTATKLCTQKTLDALVTGPLNKHIINAGNSADSSPFSGHTEYLAALTRTPRVVMMLTNENQQASALRVALATTHLPLRDVPQAITQPLMLETVAILHRELRDKFGITRPKILVCGLNPHAGEQGDLGREEIDIINPALLQLRQQGIDVSDALPADTLFTTRHLNAADAVLAMYHDQGLPVLKSHSFGQAVNVTLGLPFIRTSVDHGTAFDLAGSGKADESSLIAAIDCAINIAARTRDGAATAPTLTDGNAAK